MLESDSSYIPAQDCITDASDSGYLCPYWKQGKCITDEFCGVKLLREQKSKEVSHQISVDRE